MQFMLALSALVLLAAVYCRAVDAVESLLDRLFRQN
jgi:hypothetical protein